MKPRDPNDVLLEYGTEGLRSAFDKAPRIAPEAKPKPPQATPWTWIDPTKIPRRQWLYGTHVIRGLYGA